MRLWGDTPRLEPQLQNMDSQKGNGIRTSTSQEKEKMAGWLAGWITFQHRNPRARAFSVCLVALALGGSQKVSA